MDSLNKEFDDLVKDANRKTEFYDSYQDKPEYSEEDLLKKTNKEVREFINMSNSESYSTLRAYDSNQLNKLLSQEQNNDKNDKNKLINEENNYHNLLRIMIIYVINDYINVNNNYGRYG
mgnify:CR=1 FL=1